MFDEELFLFLEITFSHIVHRAPWESGVNNCHKGDFKARVEMGVDWRVTLLSEANSSKPAINNQKSIKLITNSEKNLWGNFQTSPVLQ